MPDFQGFSIVRNGTASLPNAPTWNIQGKITDSQTGDVLHDFTGANTIKFPQVLGNLTNAQQDRFVQEVVQMLIRWRFGLDDA